MSMKIITGPPATQGTDEWLEWRLLGIGASDAPVVMGRALSATPYGLFLEKRRLVPGRKGYWRMDRGHALEPIARAAYEEETGNIMVPLIAESAVNPFIRASFDGVRPDWKLTLEVKCPGEKAHSMALQGIVPPYYVDQVQHQIYVAETDEAHYYSFDGNRGKLIVVPRDQKRIDQIVEAELRFWDKVQSGKWETDEFAAAAALWLVANEALEEAKARESEARTNLVSHLEDTETKKEGAGVSVTRVVRKGNVDYDALLASKNVTVTEAELDSFRKTESKTVQVKATKKGETNTAPLMMKPASKLIDQNAPALFEPGFILTM